MAIIELAHDYAASPDDVWAIATDYDALATVCAPLLKFHRLPEGRCFSGQIVKIDVQLFGILPKQAYEMEVVACDDAARVLKSEERGAGAKHWNHCLRVEATAFGARLYDEIDIDAGRMTPLFVAWAKFMYKSRHKPRLRLLGLET